MSVAFYASEPHYAANISSVYCALPEAFQGDFGDTVPRGTGPVVVSSYNDLRKMRDRRVIFMEHGVGQTYGENLASYAGATQRDGVVMFLSPNMRVARLNARAHRGITQFIVGRPYLDPFWDAVPTEGVVGLAWHWDAGFCPEGRSALAHYEAELANIAARFDVIGTAHPRIANEAAKVYANAGIEFVSTDQVFEEASVLVADNTSVGWDFIALDRPVVWCNAPWYRREIHHGIRFWDYVDAGIEIDEPAELAWAIDKALTRDDKAQRRKEVRDALYPYADGHAGRRAAAHIMEYYLEA